MIQFLYPEGKTRALTFSYDDGQIHDRRLIDMMNENAIKGTFHLNAGTIGKTNFVEKDEIAQLYKGHEIACHGLNHPVYNRLSSGELIYEILEDRKQLEEYCDYIIRGMSYPYGAYDDEVIKMAIALGVEYSRTVESTGNFYLPDNFMKWHPTCHHNDLTLQKVEEFLQSGRAGDLTLLYVWGHSYEFDRENNWEHIEKMCNLLGHNNSIWYATNLQIKDYLEATKNLILSVDTQIVYNPTSTTLWIDTQKGIKKLEPGETWKQKV